MLNRRSAILAAIAAPLARWLPSNNLVPYYEYTVEADHNGVRRVRKTGKVRYAPPMQYLTRGQTPFRSNPPQKGDC